MCSHLFSPAVLAVGAEQTVAATVVAGSVKGDVVLTLAGCCTASTGLTNGCD